MTMDRTTTPGAADRLDLDAARAVAVNVAEAAGRLLSRRSSAARDIRDKGPDGDVVTDLDVAAEELIVDRLRSTYPEHLIIAEESGQRDGDDQRWTWLVDPLDGTNNVAIGLPTYGVGLALCHDGVPVVGVVHEPVTGSTWSAVRDRGASGPGFGRRRGRPHAPTLGWTQGYAVARDDPLARSLRLVLEANAHRVLQLWAPLLCWVMLARGDIDGVVGYRPEAIDLPAGALIAREAGMQLNALHGDPFDDGIGQLPLDPDRDRSFVAGSPRSVDWLVALVKDAKRFEPALTGLWRGEDLVRPMAAGAARSNGRLSG